MISPWIEITEINGAHWVNLWKELGRLFASGSKLRKPALILFHEEGQVIRAMRGGVPVPSGFPYPGMKGLRELAEAHDAGRVVGIDTRALPRVWAEIEGRVRYGDDLLGFANYVVRALKKSSELGLDFSPALALPPIVPRVVLDQVMNLILPDNRSLAFYVLEDGAVFTSLLLRKHGGSVTHLTTDDGLGVSGIDAGKWKDDLPRLTAEIGRRLGPLWAGVFLERETLARLAAGETTVKAAMAEGTLVYQPWPRRWSGILSIWRWTRG